MVECWLAAHDEAPRWREREEQEAPFSLPITVHGI